MTKNQIQTTILEKLEKQGYKVGLAHSKEDGNVIIIEDLREFLKNCNCSESSEKIVVSITEKDFELFHNCHLLSWVTKRLINPVSFERNIFRVIGYQEEIGNTLDLIIYINGIPLITWKIGEVDTRLGEIYEQLQKECQIFQKIYNFNAFSLISRGLKEVRYGIPWVSNEPNKPWGYEWKDLQEKYLCFKGETTDYVIENLLNKKDLISIIKNFICSTKDKYQEKKICWYQQFYLATQFEKEIDYCIKSSKNHAGIQKIVPRAGRAHLLLFLCKLLLPRQMPIIVFTDRTDVQSKLLQTFKDYEKFLDTSEIHVVSAWNLYHRFFDYEQILLADINVLSGVNEIICEDRVICIFYEVGSREYKIGIVHKIDKGGNEVSIIPRMERLRRYLPNAIFLELASDTKSNSRLIFGNVYDNEYQINDLIRDGIAMKWNYEDRSQIRSISGKQNLDFGGGGRMQEETRAKRVIRDIVEHYEDRIQSKNSTGKAIIFFGTRKIAIAAYRALREIKPDWFSDNWKQESKVHLIMPRGTEDKKIFWFREDQKISFFDLIGSDSWREELKISFEADSSRFKIAIAVGHLMRGFTNDLLDTIYLDRSPPPTVLKQIITRVNGRAEGKTSALIVSYNSGATRELKKLWKGQLQSLSMEQAISQ